MNIKVVASSTYKTRMHCTDCYRYIIMYDHVSIYNQENAKNIDASQNQTKDANFAVFKRKVNISLVLEWTVSASLEA